VSAPHLFLDGLQFPEGPRWRDGYLWLSDQIARTVLRVDSDGLTETVASLRSRPSGLAMDDANHLFVVAMGPRQILRVDLSTPDAAPELYADLATHSPGGGLNDMVMDAHGRLYVGALGVGSCVWRVDPDRSIHVAASGLEGPNGCIFSPDGTTFIVAEHPRHRVLAFDVDADGSLSGQRLFAQFTDAELPDGICGDVDGGVWVSTYVGHEFVRVLDGGTVTDRITTSRGNAVACVLGGTDMQTLFCLCAEPGPAGWAGGDSVGWIETHQVVVPGAPNSP
jgi:sugar lactone lactonase YvrE